MRGLALALALVVWCWTSSAAALPRVVLPGNEAYFAELLAGGPLPGGWEVESITIDHDVARYRLARGADRVDLSIVERDAEGVTEHSDHLGLILPGPPADPDLLRELAARARRHDVRDPFSVPLPRAGDPAPPPPPGRELDPAARVRLARVSSLALLALAIATGVARRRRSPWLLPVLLACAAALIGVLHHAWLSDDAAVFLLYARNLREGHGLVANLGHRVQGFTSPLWLFACAAVTTLAPATGPYWLALAGTIALLMALVSLGRRLQLGAILQVALIALTFGSNSVLSFQTSGLEGALLHALVLGGLLAAVISRHSVRARLAAVCAAALLPVTRLDAALIAIPLLLVATGARPTRREVALALAPLGAWLLFATIYFGYPLPVTWYAKVGGLSLGWRLENAGRYLADAALHEPLFVASAIAALLTWRRRDLAPAERAIAAIALGGLAYVPYLAFVGGDFMRGRMLVPLHLTCAPLLVTTLARAARSDGARASIALGAVTLSLFASARDTRGMVVDERRYYPEASLFRYGASALASPPRPLGVPSGISLSLVGVHDHEALALDPRVHFIHVWGLTDPFIARCPPSEGGRPGHVPRLVPLAYLRARRDLSIHGGLGALSADRAGTLERVERAARDPQWRDEAARRLFEDLEALATAPLWSRERWALIPRFTLSSQRLEGVGDALALTPARVPGHASLAPSATPTSAAD